MKSFYSRNLRQHYRFETCIFISLLTGAAAFIVLNDVETVCVSFTVHVLLTNKSSAFLRCNKQMEY